MNPGTPRKNSRPWRMKERRTVNLMARSCARRAIEGVCSNAIAEVEAGLPPTEAEAIKEYVIVRAGLLNQDELLPEGWQ